MEGGEDWEEVGGYKGDGGGVGRDWGWEEEEGDYWAVGSAISESNWIFPRKSKSILPPICAKVKQNIRIPDNNMILNTHF